MFRWGIHEQCLAVLASVVSSCFVVFACSSWNSYSVSHRHDKQALRLQAACMHQRRQASYRRLFVAQPSPVHTHTHSRSKGEFVSTSDVTTIISKQFAAKAAFTCSVMRATFG